MKILEFNKEYLKYSLRNSEEITQKRESYLSCEDLRTLDNRGILGKKEREFYAHNLSIYLDKNYERVFDFILNENFKNTDKLSVKVEMLEFLLIGSLYMLIEKGLAKNINAKIKMDELYKLVFNKIFKEKFESYNIKRLEKKYRYKIQERKREREEKRGIIRKTRKTVGKKDAE